MEKKKEECCELEIEELKEKYSKLQKKYPLPSFKEMEEDFEISKLDCESETLLRDIRKVIINKYSSWLSFVESLLNPSGGSMFQMYLVKSINGDEKKILNKLFSEIGEIEIQSIELEINYNEQKEAKFIIESFKKWQEMKKPLLEITESLKQNWKKETVKKEKSYFG